MPHLHPPGEFAVLEQTEVTGEAGNVTVSGLCPLLPRPSLFCRLTAADDDGHDGEQDGELGRGRGPRDRAVASSFLVAPPKQAFSMLPSCRRA